MSDLVGAGSANGAKREASPPAPVPVPPAQPGPEAMSGEPVRRTVTLTNPLGLHMRPMSAFVQLASRFQSQVTVIAAEDRRADGRSMIGLMGLAAEQGTVLIVEAVGPDQEAAAEALAQFLANLSEEQSEL